MTVNRPVAPLSEVPIRVVPVAPKPVVPVAPRPVQPIQPVYVPVTVKPTVNVHDIPLTITTRRPVVGSTPGPAYLPSFSDPKPVQRSFGF